MNDRQIYIDWIRIFLIFSVFLFHVGMVFNGWDWHIKNDVRVEALNPVMMLLHAWRMPLLFLVSGAGTRFALGFRRKKQYVAERSKRLLIPLIFGIFLLVPVQVYIEKINQYPNLLNFYQHMFDGVYPAGNFSWHHLWFIVYLFFISMVFVPFIGLYRSRYYRGFDEWLVRLSSGRAGLLLLYVPILLSQIVLRPYFPKETHAFINDWAYMCLDFLYFLYGFVLLGNQKIVETIQRDRQIFLAVTIICIGLMFGALSLFNHSRAGWLVYDVLSLLMSWSVGLAIIGYGRKYANNDRPLRSSLNKAIYPFYLLHQPIIIVVAYFVVPLGFPVFLKALFIVAISLIIIWIIYHFLIVPFNFMRLIFGMKRKDSIVPKETVRPAFAMISFRRRENQAL